LGEEVWEAGGAWRLRKTEVRRYRGLGRIVGIGGRGGFALKKTSADLFYL
jgi:hypothetical protein